MIQVGVLQDSLSHCSEYLKSLWAGAECERLATGLGQVETLHRLRNIVKGYVGTLLVPCTPSVVILDIYGSLKGNWEMR